MSRDSTGSCCTAARVGLVRSRDSTGRASLYLIFVRSTDSTGRDSLTLSVAHLCSV